MDQPLCLICTEPRALVLLKPCNHEQICLHCTSRLDKKCPFCNGFISSVRLQDTSEEVPLMDLTSRIWIGDKHARGNALQIGILGSDNAAKEFLRKEVEEKYAISEDLMGTPGPFRSKFRGDMSAFGYEFCMHVNMMCNPAYVTQSEIDEDFPDVILIIVQKKYADLISEVKTWYERSPPMPWKMVVVVPQTGDPGDDDDLADGSVAELLSSELATFTDLVFQDLTKSNRGLEIKSTTESIINLASQDRAECQTDIWKEFSISLHSYVLPELLSSPPSQESAEQ